MPFLIDTHAHVDADIYRNDLDAIIRRALDENIWIVAVGNDLASSMHAIEIAEQYQTGVFAAIGMHPKYISDHETTVEKLLDLNAFRKLAQHPKVVALGECGLDYHGLPDARFTHDPDFYKADLIRRNQHTVMRAFLLLAREFRLPLLLHCRDAHDDLLQLLTEWDHFNPGYTSRGIVHAYNGTWAQAKKYFALDFLLSLTGILTNGAYQTNIIHKAPLTRLVVESDCPHLTPDAWSMRRNEPAYLEQTVTALAGLRHLPTSSFATQITENTLKMLKKIPS